MQNTENQQTSTTSRQIHTLLYQLQTDILQALHIHEPKAHIEDAWQKPNNQPLWGEGRTCILENGEVFERAGVGFSHVYGKHLPASATGHRQHLAGLPFEAIGVSLVFHPKNPYVPTVHMNVRAFCIQQNGHDLWWFGGGMDLTPYYPFKEDCIHFHQTCKKVLDAFDLQYYPKFKQQCDDYFYIKHRQEARGIGGIFFDDFNALPLEQCIELIKQVGYGLIDAYMPIVEQRKHLSYDDAQRNFQAIRRGRYVEFNLVLDRGTLFGLQSGGRTESILLSMPPNCAWTYQYQALPGSPEESLVNDFLPAQDWVNMLK